jgi:hypothetical protein
MLRRAGDVMHFLSGLTRIRTLTVVLLAAGLSVFGCGGGGEEKSAFALREGDLLFQDLDCGVVCDAIEKVTTGYKGAKFSHVGIVAEDANHQFVVIEAVQNGVQATPLQTFLGRSFDRQHQPKVVVGRVKPVFERLIEPALREASALKGKPYDSLFAVGNDRYYCSELIYEIFLRANDDNPVFPLQPMTFRDPDTGVTLAAWQEYFSQLDASIPEGQLGINPGGISRSPVLTIVYAYGIPDGWEIR